MNRKRSIIVAMAIGLISLMNVFRSPRFELLHTVDILQLVASGMCFGVALTHMFRGLKE